MRLIKHDLSYIDAIMKGTSQPEIHQVLGMKPDMIDREGTTQFVLSMIDDNDRTQYSRYILDDDDQFIGIITLKEIDREDRIASIGTWIYPERWGEGYNRRAKDEILKIGFTQLGLEAVILGVKLTNKRSMKAQEKLPYVTLDVTAEYPKRAFVKSQRLNEPFQLNIIYKEDFLNYLKVSTHHS
ncbi:GNAT family N-acetyltransferase [Macrococcus lamae]|uniref:N-acetyltransferase n=1 Tax=Macrococcus lamae TaxID=198484 RepID=A0A4R6BUW5_9STAP|nr:GNAT family N-acetyltransferase [Macrococcus lamae]TDM12106.1 N-acetyltransferase [Macrococcus lamae]